LIIIASDKPIIKVRLEAAMQLGDPKICREIFDIGVLIESNPDTRGTVSDKEMDNNISKTLVEPEVESSDTPSGSSVMSPSRRKRKSKTS